MAIFKFTKNILNSKPIDVYNNGNHYRDITFVNDIAKGIISASLRNDKKNFEIYNIGTANQYIKKINPIRSILKKKAIKTIYQYRGHNTYANANKFNTTFRANLYLLKQD